MDYNIEHAPAFQPIGLSVSIGYNAIHYSFSYNISLLVIYKHS
jgi:hypothetical protein